MKKNIRNATRQLAILAIVIGVTLQSANADEYSDVALLARSGKVIEALAKADKYLANQPKDVQMRFIKGVILGDTGKINEAVSVFTRITEEHPELPEPYNNLAVLYASQNQFDKARSALEMAIRTNPSYAVAHENLGDLYARMASQAYSKALQLNSGNQPDTPKLALIRDLFSLNIGKGQKPAVALNPAKPASAPPENLPPAITASAGKLPPLPQPQKSQPPAATSAAASAPIAVSKPEPTSGLGTESGAKEVEAAVRAWANAWSIKDMKTYLGSYDKSFDPPGSLSRAAWENERKDRITGKASISVKISGIEIKVTGNKATARFRQDYKAGELVASAKKTLEMQKSGDRWKITREYVGP